MAGLLVIAFGLLMTFDKLGLVRADEYVRFWPAGLIAIGVLKIVYARHGGPGAAGGVIFAAVGTWLLLDELAIVALDLRDGRSAKSGLPKRSPAPAGASRRVSPARISRRWSARAAAARDRPSAC